MRALGYTKAHLLDQFNIQEVEIEKPKILKTDLLVRIKAISVNPVDTKIRQRKSSDDSTPIILGWFNGHSDFKSKIKSKKWMQFLVQLTLQTIFQN